MAGDVHRFHIRERIVGAQNMGARMALAFSAFPLLSSITTDVRVPIEFTGNE